MCKAAVPAPAKSQDAVVKKKKKNSFGRCMMSPFRALLCARDVYVKTLGGCAGAGSGSKRGGGFSAGVAGLMPRARSQSAFGGSNRFGPGDDDFMDLVRANSKRAAPVAAVREAAVQRSQSAVPGIGRIDEEHSCDFDGDVKAAIGLRSQSCAVAAGRKVERAKA